MATSTQLAQALALKKQNPNLTTQEAVLQTKQATTPLNPTPTVTPTATPTVTPTTFPSTNSPIPPTSTLWKAQAIRDAQGGTLRNAVSQVEWNVGTQTFTQAPINPETGLSAPQTSQPTPQPTQAPVETQTPTPTTPPPVDKSAEIQAQNTAKMAENAQKSQLAIQERKSQAQDQAIANIPTDQKSITQSLISWVSVPNQNTQAYRNALVTYNEFKRFNWMTDVQFLDNLKQWQVSDEMDSLLSQNPNFAKAKAEFAKFQKTSSINRATQIASNIISWKEPTPVDNLSNIESKYNAPPWTNVEAYQKYVVQNEDVVRAGLKIKTLDDQIATVNKTYTDALKSLKQQYPDMPASAILTLMWSRTKDTKEVLDDLINQQTSAKGNFDMAMKMAEGSYGAYSLDLQQQQEIAKEQRTMKNSLALSQMQFDQKIAQQAQAMNDPVQAISTMVDEYKKLGIPFSRSTQQIIQEFQASGKPLAQYLTELQGQIQSKPEYQAYKDKQTGTEWQSTNITRYNPSTWANESTPIFYRKKTSGGFEAVDLSGNPIDANLIWWTGGWAPSSTYPATSFTGDTTSYIASKEWFRDKAYQDSAGVWTIWYGTTRINGKPIQPGQTITQSEAQKILWQDIAKHSTWKTLIDPNTLSPAQQTALASFEYNLWPGIWSKSAMNILDMIKSGNLKGAADEMKKYNRAGWNVVQGLVNRRNDEANMLLNSSQNTTTTQQQYSPDKIKSFEAFNWTSFPSDYKTPAQQKQYRDEYNAWRASRPWTKIETGNDILNIKIDNPTEWQSASQSYTSRMLNAVNNLMPLEKKFLDLGIKWQIAQTYLPTLLKSSDQKIMDAEKKNFITAVLRKQSGASIAPSEFAWEEMKYFPQPWDSKEVVIAKQNARNAEIKAMLSTAWVDAEWNSLSKYYNPPFIKQENIVNNAPVDKITTLKNKYF